MQITSIAGMMTAIALLTSPAAQAQMSLPGSTGILPYDQAGRVANGQGLYQENCAACHGDDLRGQDNWREQDANGFLPAPPHDETGHTWHHDDMLLFQIVALGTEAIVGGSYKSNMPGFRDQLSQDDILDILAYIKSTWPDEVIETHNQINARSQKFGN